MLSSSQLTPILDAELKRKIVAHHLESFEMFCNTGIKQIMTDGFKIEGSVNVKDGKIFKVDFSLKVTHSEILKPVYDKHMSGKRAPLTPSIARLNELTYTSPLKINAEVKAIAYYSDGGTKERVEHIKEFHICGIPTMVRSKYCHTYNKSKDALQEMGEDPLDRGGYFVIKGNEWIIENTENIQFNVPRTYHNVGHGNELARCEIISKAGDAFENSNELIIILVNDGTIICKLVTQKTHKNNEELKIPFYLLFRALGVSSDKEMFEHILYEFESPISLRMQSTLEKAMRVKYESLPERIYDQASVIEYLGKNIDIYDKYYNDKRSAKREIIGGTKEVVENNRKYIMSSVLNTLDTNLLPHMGLSAEHRPHKIRYLGYLIRRLLLVEMDIIPSTSRDSYDTKRVHPAGPLLSKVFKTQYNNMVVMTIRRALTKELTETPFENAQLAQVITSKVHGSDFEKMLVQAITASDKGVSMHGHTYPSHISSQQLHHKNPLNVLSQLRTVSTANTGSSKASTRADEMRRVHPSYIGYICPAQSADTGEKVGLQKQLAITASITSAGHSYILREKVLSSEHVIKLNDVTPATIYKNNLTYVFVNGTWIGLTADPYALRIQFRNMRRNGVIDRQTTISWNIQSYEIHFWVDLGRIIRPLLIVYNTNDPYDTTKKVKKESFEQNVAITKQDLHDLITSKITIDTLFEKGIIEYISPEEQATCYLATSYEDLQLDKNNPLKPYTHCEIPPAICGLVTLTSPYATHNQVARVCYQTNQAKQTAGWGTHNYKTRSDKDGVYQYHNSYALVHTMTNNYVPPNGDNVVVAVCIDEGYNQEDSLISSSSASKRGLFTCTYLSYKNTELDRGEEFNSPNPSDTTDIKTNANYTKLVKGRVSINTVISTNDAIIGKRYEIPPDEVRDYKYSDRSIIYTGAEDVVVVNVIEGRNHNDVPFIKVVYRSIRDIKIGDKFSARSGQKGVCGMIMNTSDMPFTENGIIPDLIMNPQAYPSRMTVSQLIEALASKLCAILGHTVDGTIFENVDIDYIKEMLRSLKYEDSGCEWMYNGRTGRRMMYQIFIAPNYYQRLQKFVANSTYAVSTGPTCMITRQPVGNRTADGGIRLGEMERDAIVANGSCDFLSEKFREHSDKFTMYICARCMKTESTIVNTSKNHYKCKRCGDLADIRELPSTWSANMMIKEIRALGIDTYLKLAPPTFEKELQ